MNFLRTKHWKKDKATPQADGSDLDSINKGEVIFDATACPQDIVYPADIGLLHRFREIVEAMIDDLHATHP
jgi:hypothetical protein